MKETEIRELIERAAQAREFAYAPYSDYMVGAALLAADGEIYTGCNVENAAYGPSNCAERTAVFKAVSEGKRSFTAIAIVGGKRDGEGDFATPCGVCRQVLAEFDSAGSMTIIAAKSTEEYQIYTLKELLPHGFGPENLETN
jgi:cytidine deaminase